MPDGPLSITTIAVLAIGYAIGAAHAYIIAEWGHRQDRKAWEKERRELQARRRILTQPVNSSPEAPSHTAGRTSILRRLARRPGLLGRDRA